VATTRSRPRGRESARPSTGGVAGDHAAKIYSVAVGAVVVIIAFLALTGTGHVIDAATQHFMLYYAGVFTLIALCASVTLGLVATDRMILNPGHRIWVQSAHRAASFGALVFLIIHIVTEILAQRVHALDAFVPFLSPFRTFYIGLGTIASDLILLLVITGILRKRFTANGNAWRWRAIHYASYLAFIFGVWHGLLGGRPGKPYVDWSYGFVVAFVALGLAVRILANSMRPKENLSGPPVPDSAGSGSGPMRAASMFAQLSLARAAASQTALNARSGPQPMLTAPVGDWNERPATGPRTAVAALPAAGPGSDGRPPLYEPGYEGPPRYLGAPRSGNTGPQPRLATGPQPRLATGPQPRAATGPMPRATGSYPAASYPAGSYPAGSYPGGSYPARSYPAGALPRATTGPMPRAATGPMPRANTGPMPQAGNAARGGGARGAAGPRPRPATGPMPRPGTGPMPRATTGPMPRAATGPMPRAATGPHPRPATGPMPQPGTGPMPRATTGPMPRAATGPMPRAATGPRPRPRAGGPSGEWETPAPPQAPRAPRAPRANGRHRDDGQQYGGPQPQWQAPRDAADWTERDGGNVEWNYDLPPWDGGAPEPDPGFRYREPGPGMPGYRGSRNPYRGGDNLR
jgi:DMSO/TMAO reductase YedYZ heme-binding membrane subunit